MNPKVYLTVPRGAFPDVRLGDEVTVFGKRYFVRELRGLYQGNLDTWDIKSVPGSYEFALEEIE